MNHQATIYINHRYQPSTTYIHITINHWPSTTYIISINHISHIHQLLISTISHPASSSHRFFSSKDSAESPQEVFCGVVLRRRQGHLRAAAACAAAAHLWRVAEDELHRAAAWRDHHGWGMILLGVLAEVDESWWKLMNDQSMIKMVDDRRKLMNDQW